MANDGEGIIDELTPRQIDFLRFYNDPLSDTFSNALQSAIRAGYTEEYAQNIKSNMPNWLSENVARRKKMLAKAENRLDISIDSDDERVALDASKFIAKTLGKDEGYSERTELTGKDGEKLIPKPIIDVSNHDSDPQNQTDVQEDTGGAGGSVSQQDNLNPALPDSPSPERQDANPDQHCLGNPTSLEEGSDEGLLDNLTGA